MNILRKTLLLAACTAALVLGSATMASAYSGGTVTGPGTVAPGGSINLTGSGFGPNTPITITISGGTVITGNVTDASGNWTASIPAPNNLGTYTITVSGGQTTGSTTVTVAASGGGGGLPVTGSSNSLPLTQTGAALVAAGALVVFGVRRSASKNVREDVTV